MGPLPWIDLVSSPQPDTEIGRGPAYSIYARDRLVGRIYCRAAREDFEQWIWGVNGVLTSGEIGPLQGFAESFDEAKAQLRTAFDLWLAWGLVVASSHLSSARIRQDLRDVGALSEA